MHVKFLLCTISELRRVSGWFFLIAGKFFLVQGLFLKSLESFIFQDLFFYFERIFKENFTIFPNKCTKILGNCWNLNFKILSWIIFREFKRVEGEKSYNLPSNRSRLQLWLLKSRESSDPFCLWPSTMKVFSSYARTRRLAWLWWWQLARHSPWFL